MDLSYPKLDPTGDIDSPLTHGVRVIIEAMQPVHGGCLQPYDFYAVVADTDERGISFVELNRRMTPCGAKYFTEPQIKFLPWARVSLVTVSQDTATDWIKGN